MKVDPQRAVGTPDNNPNKPPAATDDATTARSGNSDKNPTETNEYHVKWCLNGISDKNKAHNVYATILATLLEAHEDDLIILAHDRQEIAWDCLFGADDHKEFIKKSKLPLYEAKSKGDKKLQRWYGTCTFRTDVSLSNLKNHYMVTKMIKEHKAYGAIHRFELKEWDIAHIGFLRGYNNIHMNSTTAILRIQEAAHTVNPDCPPFQIATARTRPNKTTTTSKFSTPPPNNKTTKWKKTIRMPLCLVTLCRVQWTVLPI
jgi:hypothetical protein